ncbi:MAG: TIGR03111 family XrtG-associated glycosyltransferase [Lachnospiraceae bacterium]
MGIIRRILNSFVFWGAWILIPLVMEIVPALGSIVLLVIRRLRRKKPYETPGLYPEISIIIPVYNSADTLYNCIKSIKDSNYPNDSIRIFLVNNQGQDDSFSVYAQCQEQFPELRMQWMNSRQGKSRALNLALYNSEGKYIINLDSDGMLEKNALKNMIEKFEANPELNCMTGAILTTPDDIKKYKSFWARLLRNLEFMEYAQAFLAGRSYASELNSVYTLSGAFSAFRKSAILKSRMYNTDTICEDTQITFQMRYIYKERVEICEDAIFFVDPIENVNKLYTQRQRWQRGSLEVAKMFMDENFRLSKMFTDINVKTLLYDHTFAFPRLIWYLALLCLLFMNYSGKVILYSTGMIFALYILIGFLYFWTVVVFLRKMPEVQDYYKKHWWCVLLLPAFNLVVFFIRVAGVINSINTDSAWRTKNLTDERRDLVATLRSVLQKPLKLLEKLKRVVNKEGIQVKDSHEKLISGDKLPENINDTGVKTEVYAGASVLWHVGVGILYFFGVALLSAGYWVGKTYGVGVNEIINTLTGPLQGTGSSVVWAVIKGCLLPAVAVVAVYILLVVIYRKTRDEEKAISHRRAAYYRIFHQVVAGGSVVILLVAVLYINCRYDLLGYYQVRASESKIYEEYYVNPAEVEISTDGKTKNLIYIYLESMETTYASVDDGGIQPENYMPELTLLAEENVSFSDKQALGGFHSLNGTGYTMGAIFGTTTGVPYALPVDSTMIGGEKSFASGIVSLGDILAEDGYNQEFLCGSDGDFGGRKQYFMQHGGYNVFDLYTAREKGYIDDDYYVWWGFEDKYVFEIAKDEILRLWQEGEPFNMTILTCDTHHIEGYVCDLCGNEYDSVTANVVSCTDRQLGEFISWCREQEFFDDTVIVITGDHPRMDTCLVEGVNYYDRTVYNCFINSVVEPAGNINDREFTTLDIFPTVLAAMGYKIEGDRLGLGTNLFSTEQTLAEQKGYDWLNRELTKDSDYYVSVFAPELQGKTKGTGQDTQ